MGIVCSATRDVQDVYAEQLTETDIEAEMTNAIKLRKELEELRCGNLKLLCKYRGLSEYINLYDKMCHHWNTVICLSRRSADNGVPICTVFQRDSSSLLNENTITEATGFSYRAEGALHLLQIKQYATERNARLDKKKFGVRKSEIKQAYATVKNFASWSVKLIQSLLPADPNAFGSGVSREDDKLIHIYKLNLLYGMIADCCSYVHCGHSSFLYTAYSAALIEQRLNASQNSDELHNMSFEVVKRKLSLRAIATVQGDGKEARESSLREILSKNFEPYEFCLRKVLNLNASEGGQEPTNAACSAPRPSTITHELMMPVRMRIPARNESDIINFAWTNGRLSNRDLYGRFICQFCFQPFQDEISWKKHENSAQSVTCCEGLEVIKDQVSFSEQTKRGTR